MITFPETSDTSSIVNFDFGGNDSIANDLIKSQNNAHFVVLGESQGGGSRMGEKRELATR
jgi:hypothetical protein